MWAGDANGDGQVNFQGVPSDASELFLQVLSAAGNTSFSRNYLLSGYDNSDLNLDGMTVFQGAQSDNTLIFLNILSHPGNASTFQRNYVVQGTIPD